MQSKDQLKIGSPITEREMILSRIRLHESLLLASSYYYAIVIEGDK